MLVAIYQKSCENMDELKDGSVDLVVTSPPYWNSIDYDQHTKDPEKWYRTRKGTPYDEYLDWLTKCFLPRAFLEGYRESASRIAR